MATVPATTLSTQATTIAQPGVTEQTAGLDVVPFIRMSKEEMDDILFEQRLQQEEAREEGKNIPGTRTERFAKYVASRVATQVPGQMTYESLKDGTAPIFEELSSFQGVDPRERALTDDQILQLLVRNPDGQRIERGSFLEGVKEEIAPQVGGFAGAVAGAKAGAALVAGVPPVTPPTIAAKFLVPAVGAIIGGLFGQEATRTGQRKLVGEESLILPETTGPYEAGKTTAGVLGFFAVPWALGRKLTGEAREINFGAQQFIENARRLKMAAEPAQDAAKLGRNYTGTDLSRLAQQADNIPRSTRGLAMVEKGLQSLGRQSREQPKTLAAIEGFAGAGQAYLGQMAEEAAPGEVLPRVLAETTGGILGASVGQPTISIVGALPTFLKEPLAPYRALRDLYRRGGLKAVFEKATGKDARREKAVRYILELFEQQGENVDDIIARLNEVNTFLIDPETNQMIDLTAPAKSGSGTLLGIEAALSSIAPTLAKQRIAGSEKAVQAMRAQVKILASVAGSDPELLQGLADQMKIIFDANFATDISYATEILTRALGREGLGTTGLDDVDALALDQQQLGQKLYDIMDSQLRRARAQERSLWRNVPKIEQSIDPENIPSFQFQFDEFEEPVETNFIEAWNRLLPSTPEAQEVFFDNAKVLKKIQKFVERKQEEFFEEGAEEGFNLFRSGAILSSQELTDMRSIALSAVRKLRSESKFDEARIAGRYADILLAQLDEFPDESFTVPYREARAFSRSLNDTFTRAFAGNILEQNAKGGTRDAPELLADRLLRGGASSTLLRINQIQEAGRFMGPSFMGPVQLVPGLSQVQESILRAARTTALKPNTPEGAVNRNNLGRFIKENENLLNLFPALRADLENIDTASVLLNQTEEFAKRKQRELEQDISFMNLTSDEKRSPARAVAQVFSPSTEFPYKALDRFVEVVNSAPDEAQRNAAAKALQGAIVEWAATSGGMGSNGQFKPSVMYKALFTPDAVKFQTKAASISPIEYMQQNDLITQQEVTNLNKLLREMIKYEAGVQQGNIEKLAAEAGPLFDFFLRVSGATIGARTAEAMGNRQTLVAAGAGSKAIRNVAYNLPLAMQMDVMAEFMENPEMLAAWLTKYKGTTAGEREGVLNAAMSYLQRMGINIFRRPAPGVGREATEEGLIVEPVTEAIIGKPVEREERFGTEETPRTAPPPPPVSPAPPIVQTAPQTNPQSLQRAVQVLGMDDEIGGLASEMLMRQRPS